MPQSKDENFKLGHYPEIVPDFFASSTTPPPKKQRSKRGKRDLC